MDTQETLRRLTQAVTSAAAIRRIRKLQPAGGPGDKVFPPTYPGERKDDPPRHVFERRRIAGSDVLCVLIDSVQSQANRLEESLRAERDGGRVSFPVISVDFTKTELADLGQITTLDAPHRIFDAIVRDSQEGDVRFKDTDVGKRLIQAKPGNARVVFEVSPAALLFGAWNSTGEGGGLGAKFPRAIVSEIVGINVATEIAPATGEVVPSGRRTGSRIDPLGIRSGVKVYKGAGDWSLEAPKKGSKSSAKEVRPSEVNHSNIAPTVQVLGVSVDHIQHTFVLSLAAIRRLRVDPDPRKEEVNGAARTMLAALGLLAATAQDRAGYALRSRCDLVPEHDSSAAFEIIGADGSTETFELGPDDAVALFKAAVAAAGKDAAWRTKDVVLTPQPKLVELVRKSRLHAMEGVEDDGE